MNELTGKKDNNASSLSFDDQRNLMSGSRTSGPTLAIGGTNPSQPSFNSNQNHVYVS